MGWRKSKKYLILINKLRKYRFARRNWRARIETSDDDADGDDSEHVIVRATPSLDSEARRKLEDALEERRLRKQIQDYDFDFD